MKPLYIFLVIFAIQIKLSYSQNKKFAQDTIIWSSSDPLAKEDFKGKKSSRNMMAGTASGLFIHSEDKGGTLMFYVEAIFYKSKSFMKEDSPYTLKHEQLHFDITELFARKLRQKIIQRDFKKTSNVREAIQKMFDKAYEDCEREQSKYDADTEHGLNAAKQQVWSEKIKQQLQELEQFSSTEIDIANK